MDFELKTLDLGSAAADEKRCGAWCWSAKASGGQGCRVALVAAALKARDLEPKPGKLLQAYRAEGIAAPAVMLAGSGDGSASGCTPRAGRRRRAAQRTARKLTIVLPAGSGDDAGAGRRGRDGREQLRLRATKSKPEGRELQTVVVVAGEAAARARPGSSGPGRGRRHRVGARTGPTCRPTCTPTRLGEEAAKLAKAHGFRCEVLGPQGNRQARHGLLPGRRPGLERAAALHRPALRRRRQGRRADRAGRQGHHLRHRRHLDQARRPRWTR